MKNLCEFWHISWHPSKKKKTCGYLFNSLAKANYSREWQNRSGIRRKINYWIKYWRLNLDCICETIYSEVQLDRSVTDRDHKSDQATEGQHLPGIMSNQPCFRQRTHPLLQLFHMLYLQSTINDLISLGHAASIFVSETARHCLSIFD